MTYTIGYRYRNPVWASQTGIMWAEEVMVDDKWDSAKIKDWYESRHSGVHHDGIVVTTIIPHVEIDLPRYE